MFGLWLNGLVFAGSQVMRSAMCMRQRGAFFVSSEENIMNVKNIASKIMGGAVLLTAAGAALAEGPDFAATATQVGTTLAAAGAAGLVIMNAGLIWDTGMSLYKKYLKKGAK